MADEKQDQFTAGGAVPAPTDIEAVAAAPVGGTAPGGVGGDDALAMVGEQQRSYDPAIAARAVRKIDWFLMPAMIFGCMSCHAPLPS